MWMLKIVTWVLAFYVVPGTVVTLFWTITVETEKPYSEMKFLETNRWFMVTTLIWPVLVPSIFWWMVTRTLAWAVITKAKLQEEFLMFFQEKR